VPAARSFVLKLLVVLVRDEDIDRTENFPLSTPEGAVAAVL
jgi:hypothetical protein